MVFLWVLKIKIRILAKTKKIFVDLRKFTGNLACPEKKKIF